MKTFPITTGRDSTPTPEGNFCIITKYKNKEYHRKKIPGGAPNNPLGTRWLGLDKKSMRFTGQIGNGQLEVRNQMVVSVCTTEIYSGYMTEYNCRQK